MLKGGAKPKIDVLHERDVYVWHPSITELCYCDIVRLSFYQTIVGDEQKLNAVRKQIQEISYNFEPDTDAANQSSSIGNLHPRIFKKESRSAKTKSVDINLTVDILRHAYQSKFDVILLLSGDGDYLPLIEEVSRFGMQIWVAAFSDGLNPQLRYAADEFFDLDEIFFERQHQDQTKV